jgi:hypothetical protein
MGLIWGSPLSAEEKEKIILVEKKKKKVNWKKTASLRQFSDGGTIYGPDQDTELKPPRRKSTKQEQKQSKQNFDIMYVFLHVLNRWNHNPDEKMISQWIYTFNNDRTKKQLSMNRPSKDILRASKGDLLQKCKLLIEQLEMKEAKITVCGDMSTGEIPVYYKETSEMNKEGEDVKQVSILDVKSLEKCLEIQSKIIF